MANLGLLGGLPAAGGAPFQAAEKGAFDVAQLGQEERRTTLAEQAGRQSAERFQLEKQMMPLKMRQAEQQVADEDRRFKEATTAANNRVEAGNRLRDLQGRLQRGEKISAEDFALEGTNIAYLMGDAVGTHHGLQSFQEFANQTEEGKAGSALWDQVRDKGLGLKMLNGTATPEDYQDVIGMALSAPKAANVMGKGLIQRSLDGLSKTVPPAALDMMKEYLAGRGTRTGQALVSYFNETLSKHPDAQQYFLQHPEVRTGMLGGAEKIAEETAKAEAVEGVKAKFKKEIVGLESLSREKVAQIHGTATMGAARERAAATRYAADKREEGKEGGAAGKPLKGIDADRMKAARADLDAVLADPTKRGALTRANLDKHLDNNVMKGGLSSQEASMLRREYGARFPQ